MKESFEANLRVNEDKSRMLNEEKLNLDLKCREQSMRLSNLQVEVDNYSTMMQHNAKNSALLKVF
jgi:hypothetical protein